MRFDPKNPPRLFEVGNTVRFCMRDCGSLALDADEQVTFVLPSGAEYDVSRKDFGFYATPSLNGRLPQFGLRAVLIRNRSTGRYFVLLVERGQEPAFDAYLEQETCEAVAWLDSTEALERLRLAVLRSAGTEKSASEPTLRCPCGEAAHRRPAFTYDAPPEGETRFALTGAYRRRYESCELCGHWFSVHALDLSALYAGDYASATYGGPAGMAARYETIMALPEARSDNRSRVRRVRDFATGIGIIEASGPRLLDVGAGLGVFPAAMAAYGWHPVGLEPDPRTVAHLRDVAGVQAIAADLRALDATTIGRFDAISFNKVLEHVEDPVGLLKAALPLLADHGFMYVEVPDIAAAAEGPGREEFFVEHHHVFSPASLVLACERAGLAVIESRRIREPSGKFTLFAFAMAGGDAARPRGV